MFETANFGQDTRSMQLAVLRTLITPSDGSQPYSYNHPVDPSFQSLFSTLLLRYHQHGGIDFDESKFIAQALCLLTPARISKLPALPMSTELRNFIDSFKLGHNDDEAYIEARLWRYILQLRFQPWEDALGLDMAILKLLEENATALPEPAVILGVRSLGEWIQVLSIVNEPSLRSTAGTSDLSDPAWRTSALRSLTQMLRQSTPFPTQHPSDDKISAWCRKELRPGTLLPVVTVTMTLAKYILTGQTSVTEFVDTSAKQLHASIIGISSYLETLVAAKSGSSMQDLKTERDYAIILDSLAPCLLDSLVHTSSVEEARLILGHVRLLSISLLPQSSTRPPVSSQESYSWRKTILVFMKVWMSTSPLMTKKAVDRQLAKSALITVLGLLCADKARSRTSWRQFGHLPSRQEIWSDLIDVASTYPLLCCHHGGGCDDCWINVFVGTKVSLGLIRSPLLQIFDVEQRDQWVTHLALAKRKSAPLALALSARWLKPWEGQGPPLMTMSAGEQHAWLHCLQCYYSELVSAQDLRLGIENYSLLLQVLTTTTSDGAGHRAVLQILEALTVKVSMVNIFPRSY